MHAFTITQGTRVRLLYGLGVTTALRLDPATRDLAPDLEQANRHLAAAAARRMGAVDAVVVTRAELGMLDQHLKRKLLQLCKTVQAETGLRGSRLEKELFPKGLTAAQTPMGERKLRTAQDLLGRLGRSASQGSEATRAAWLEPLRAHVAAFAAALGARKAAKDELKVAGEAEELAREAHSTALMVVSGQLLSVYPRERRLRKAFEPPKLERRAQGALDEGVGDDDLGDEPAVAEPASAGAEKAGATDAA